MKIVSCSNIAEHWSSGAAGTFDLARLAQAGACAAHTVAEAVAVVNAPALTRVYEAKVGEVPGMRLAAIR